MARTVPLKLNYASRSGLVKGPQYTIQEDPPWLQPQAVSATSPAEPRPSSTYSEEDMAAMLNEASSPASGPPLGLQKSNSPDGSSSRPDAVDGGSKSSRLPIFKQMRSMLSSSKSPTGAGAMKWDEYSGEPSENGKERLGVKPSTYKSPYEGILKSRKQASPVSGDDSPRMGSSRVFSPMMMAEEHPESPVMDQRFSPVAETAVMDPVAVDHQHESPAIGQQREPMIAHEQLESPMISNNARRLSPAGLSDQRAVSPVSALIEDDLHILEQQTSRRTISPPNSRSVSPILTYEQLRPAPRDTDEMQRPRTESGRVKRKPVASTQFDDFPSSELRIKPNSSHGISSQQSEDPASRFSWTTAAQSEAPRKSTDTRYSRPAGHDSQYNSHFSWSTVASTAPAMAGAMREQTPPPSPPPVPAQYLEPPVYGTPPTQSILSRHRPFKKVEKAEWAPPPPTSKPHTPRALSPKVYRIQDDYEISTTPTVEGKKRLPLPPLFTEKSLSHLEGLLTREKNIVLQRRNIERSILDLEKVEKASPLEVSFAAVREAKKKLDERRGVLDEIRKEEMDIGIRIARARRKEDFGDGEGTLWVRRVTG